MKQILSNINRFFLLGIVCMLGLFSVASCTDQSAGTVPESVKTPMTVSITTKAGGQEQAVAIETVRLLTYDNTGRCLSNELIPESEMTSVVDGDKIVITMNPEISVPGDVQSVNMYAVLNENGMFSSVSGSEDTLSKSLDSFAVNSYTLDDFMALMNADFLWEETSSEISSGTASLLMFLQSENISVAGRKSQDTINVDLTGGEEIVPSMAIIEVDRITSEAIDGLAYSRLSDASRVFVLDVNLESIPSTYSVGQTKGSKSLKSVKMLKQNKNGYCDRTWDGTISQTTEGDLHQVDRVEERYYRYAVGSQGENCWSIVTQDKAAVYSSIKASDRYNGNNGNIRDFINTQLKPLFSNPDHYVSDPLDKDDLQDDAPVPSQTSWNIPVNKSFYVTENLSGDAASATCIVIKLAIAQPDLDHSAITDDEWSSYAAWTNPEFCSDGYPMASYTSSARDFFAKFSHACWSDNKDMIDVAQSGKSYNFFVGNFTRENIGAVNKKFKTGDKKIKTSWKKIADSEKIVEIRVPINNCRFDSDYSIRRGVKYTISLHVDGTTYDKILSYSPTKAGQVDSDFIQTDVSVSNIE